MEGLEYLIHLHDKIRLEHPVKLMTSGDSTTEGAGISDTRYLMHNLCKSMLNQYGVENVTAINAGHSGEVTTTWQSTFISQDMAQNPDLYIVRWGINDGSVAGNRLQVFMDALRGGLATIRASKSVQELSIILMTPNSTNDPYNGRDAIWYEAICEVIKQAARDYQCCFVDTYHHLLDSTNVIWQDAPMPGYPDVHIHPLETGNAWIASQISEALIPEALRKITAQNTPVLTWYAPTLINTWENFGTGYTQAGYSCDGNFVYLKGLVKSGSIGQPIFVLPEGCRPQNTVILGTISSGLFAELRITPDGRVLPISGSNVWYSLDGISFHI